MNKHKIENGQLSHYVSKLLAAMLGITLFAGAPLYAAEPKAKVQKPVVTATSKQPARPLGSMEIVPSVELSLGQSQLFRLPAGTSLQATEGDGKVVQMERLSPREFLLHAKRVGSAVVVISGKSGQTDVMVVRVVGVPVAMDAAALQAKLQQIMPNEKGITVSTAADSLVLSGTVTDAVKVDKAMALAEAYSGKDKDKKVINMLQVAAPQQVMLEVKMAEVSKGLLDKLGASFGASRSNGGVAYAIASGFLSLTGTGIDALSPGGLLTITHGNKVINIDAENKEGIVKILAEPNIIAISGQEGSFLAGGKIFIPVPQTGAGGGGAPAITLEERDFGVGLKFTPTVLEGGLINLRVAPEVSELTQGGTTVGGSVFPSFTVRRVSTTVQLHDGQSFAIAGLIKNNVTESIRRFPILGEIPILGALFRSSSFQNDKTELLFVITPRLVKPLPPNYALPTDNFNEPSKAEFFLHGQLEGKPAEPVTPAVTPESAPAAPSGAVVPEQKSGQDGFEMK